MGLLKILALCITAALLGSLWKRTSPDLSLLLSLGTVLFGCMLLIGAGEEAVGFAQKLADLTGLAPEIFTPLLKTVAIALVVRFCSALCKDTGESALAALAETAGAVTALLVALPLFQAVLSLLEGYL